ncbi:MAG: AAA family ATPase [Chloroflexi bacterium]|nr:AAA family ATPase [Chloroflexota bacterium]
MTNIRIDTVRIAGFRGIRDLEITLPRVAVLIGPNNSGKTSCLKALQLALGDYSRYLCDEDVHIEVGTESSKVILVDLRIIATDDKDNRIRTFGDDWATEFGDRIMAEANGDQFLALRTRSMPNAIKGNFDITRSTLERWPDYSAWSTEKVKETRLPSRMDCLPFIAIDAQRDIHQDLHEKSSFIGRVLAAIAYDKDDIVALEQLIKDLNDTAVDKSEDIKRLTRHVRQLNRSVQGAGNVEITPFPQKIRDLSKNFSVHVGDSAENSFTMEYHGMGTRSWASLLTVKAFIDLLVDKHEKESKPCYPILAVEEPEAHLHPNAQKTLFRQLAESRGQVIISTHSPYLAAMADITAITSLVRIAGGVSGHCFLYLVTPTEKNVLAREVMSKRGEILFARALVLFEGVTEEQIIPAMFQAYFHKSIHEFGVSCVSVGGKNYAPFIKLACSFGIPVYVISDNDGSAKTEVEAQLQRLKQETGLQLNSDSFGIAFIGNGNDFEAELMGLGLRDEIIQSLVLCATQDTSNKEHVAAKQREITALSDSDIIVRMRKSKANYAGHLADVLLMNPNGKSVEEMVPAAVAQAFEQLKGWLAR